MGGEAKEVDVSEWIKCSERMPEDFEDVLATDGNEVCLGYYFEDDNQRPVWGTYPTCPFCDGEISHWMPLPEPPEE